MTDEELEQELQKLSESIAKLPDPEDSLTKEERRRKQVLLLRKEALQRMKQAREKNDKNQEFTSNIDYALLTSLGEKHPFLMYLIKSKFRWGGF